ncbi:MAG: hypothetical protein E7256_10820 [Lachnospiraceae bacterium]|nr:hypothetical protein [Lachnospiraceae bacterium]
MRNNNCNNNCGNTTCNTQNCGTNKSFSTNDEKSGKPYGRGNMNMKNTRSLRFGSGQSSEFFRQTKMRGECKEEEKSLPPKKEMNHQINKRVRQNIIHEFWRLYHAYTELEGTAHVKFDESLDNLYAALNSLGLGIKINSKGSRVNGKLDELLNALNYSCDDTSDSDDCECLKEELHKLVEQIEELEEEAMEATKKAITKLEEANELHNALNEVKEKLEQNCYPK